MAGWPVNSGRAASHPRRAVQRRAPILVLVAELAFRRRQSSAPPPTVPAPADLALDALETLAAAVLVAGQDGTVLFANPAARRLGLRGRGTTLPPALSALAASARSDGQPLEQQISLPAVDELPVRLRRSTRPGIPVRVRAHALGPDGYVVLVVEDLSEAFRVEAVRRDFVANVSHELKTPVGALQLLAEAITGASDDPVAVRHFAARMTREAARLGTLVQELIDLSRLQGAEALKKPRPVPLEQIITEAVDRNRLGAAAKGITVAVVREADVDLTVRGDETQLAMAVTNLLANAVAYSPDRTRVVIGMRRRDDVVEVSVADEGIGIAERDQQRVFERFYRADPARARATGGTGLGLAIVKHVATNHGGEVLLWSAEGKGSTFTLRLPACHRPDGEDTC